MVREEAPLSAASTLEFFPASTSLGGGIDGHGEGVDEVEPLSLQRSRVVAEEGEDQGLLGPQDLQAQKDQPAQRQIDDAHHHEGDHLFLDGKDQGGNGDGVEQDRQQQHGHAALVAGKDLFFHQKYLRSI